MCPTIHAYRYQENLNSKRILEEVGFFRLPLFILEFLYHLILSYIHNVNKNNYKTLCNFLNLLLNIIPNI